MYYIQNIRQENIDIQVGLLLIDQLLKSKQTNKYIYNQIIKEFNLDKRSETKWNNMFIEDNLSTLDYNTFNINTYYELYQRISIY